MRALDLFARLAAWRWRRAPSPALERGNADVEAAATFPAEAYKAMLDKLVEVAFEAGAREERARIAAIAKLPKAARFPRLALNLGLSGSFSAEEAAAALADADTDLRAESRPTESPAAESEGRVLH